jgi:hypothetical protein
MAPATDSPADAKVQGPTVLAGAVPRGSPRSKKIIQDQI